MTWRCIRWTGLGLVVIAGFAIGAWGADIEDSPWAVLMALGPMAGLTLMGLLNARPGAGVGSDAAADSDKKFFKQVRMIESPEARRVACTDWLARIWMLSPAETRRVLAELIAWAWTKDDDPDPDMDSEA